VPALVGPIVGFTLGVMLAWLGRGEAPREDNAAGRARAVVVALFAWLVFAPACAYFVVFTCDWALFYLTDSRTVPSALLLVLVALDATAVMAGFWVGYQAARRRTPTAAHALLALGAAPLAVAVTVVLAFLGKLRVDGTFHQVSARFGTRAVAGGPVGYAILWMNAMVVAGMVIAARALADRPRPPTRFDPTPEVRPPLLGRTRLPSRDGSATPRRTAMASRWM
jgi:hypothetical protein